jgi:NAD(P)-dependent dehydrogenase (short-subunit alcohol dehydrogenase family)
LKGNIMGLQLKDKLALISGSTAGIGLAIATELAREGARVIVNGRTSPAVDGAIAQILTKTGNPALGFAGDLSQPAAAEQLARIHPDADWVRARSLSTT